MDIGLATKSSDGAARRTTTELWDRRWQAVPVPMCATDAKGHLAGFNRRAADLWGREPCIGDDARPLLGGAAFDARTGREESPVDFVLRTGVSVHGKEAAIVRGDGSRAGCVLHIDAIEDNDGLCIGTVACVVDVTERDRREHKASEERIELMASEVDHRAKNILAVVQAVVRLTRGTDVDALRQALTGRIDALARAHRLLANSRWKGAGLQQLIDEELAPFSAEGSGRIVAQGPALMLQPAAAQSAGMALHELATNAAKHGALSSTSGRLRVAWSFDAVNGLALRWIESGGPTVRPPGRVGIGNSLIERMVRQHGGTARFDWCGDGLVFEMTLPADQVRMGAERAAIS